MVPQHNAAPINMDQAISALWVAYEIVEMYATVAYIVMNVE